MIYINLYSTSITLNLNKHIHDIYPEELQLNKANTLDNETSFLDSNIKILAVTFIQAFMTNEMTSDFFPWLSGDVPRLPL